MSDMVGTIAQALGPGAMLGLFALGLVLIYRSTGVLNLAHGAQASLGGFLYWDAVVNWGLPAPVALGVAVLASGVVGVLIHVLVMHPLRGAAKLTLLIGSIGVMLVIQSSLLLIYGSTARTVPGLLPASSVPLPGGQTVGSDRLWLLVIGICVTVALWSVYRFTTFGVRTAATAENPSAAAALGVSPSGVAMANWFIGGSLAGLSGAMLAPFTGADIVTLNALIVPGLGAALFGGLLSFPLTFVGALTVQVIQAIATASLDIRGIGGISTFVIVVVLMLVRGTAIPDRGFMGIRLPSLGSGRLSWWALPWLAIAAVVILSGDPVWVDAALTSMLIGIVMLSVVVVAGYAGQLSLAQFSLAGCGAYIAVLLARHFEWPFLVLLVVAALATIPIGLLLSIAAMRMRGASLAVITLSFSVVLYAAVFSQSQVQSVPSPAIGGIDLSPIIYPERYLAVATVVFAILAVAVANVRRSATGRRFIAVRGNERASAALGIRVGQVKATAFSIATVIAALGGVLLVFRSPSVEFTSFNFDGSVNVLAWTVIGGLGFIAGPLVGMTFASGGIGTELLHSIIGGQSSWLPLIGGIALLATVLLNQDGVASVVSHVMDTVRQRLGGHRRRQPVLEKPTEPESERAVTTSETTGSPADEEARYGPDPRPAPERPEAALMKKPTAGPRPQRQPLELQGVSVSFGGVHALSEVDLRVEPGTVHGLIGPNGAGKSTLLDAVSGFASLQAGLITLGGRDLSKLTPWQRARSGIGRSFQAVALFPDLNVEDNIRIAAESVGGASVLRDLVLPGRAPLPVAFDDVIDMLDLRTDLRRRVDQLPYGRQRMVTIARALAMDSEVILLDEPASGLDEAERQGLATAVRSIAQDRGVGVLLIEHDVDLVMATSDVVTALDFGKVIASGTPEVVRASPQVIASYLGEAPTASAPSREGATT